MACLGRCSGFTNKYIKQLKFSDISFVTQPIGHLSIVWKICMPISSTIYQAIIYGVAMLPEK
jgi:hypothetical protein